MEVDFEVARVHRVVTKQKSRFLYFEGDKYDVSIWRSPGIESLSGKSALYRDYPGLSLSELRRQLEMDRGTNNVFRHYIGIEIVKRTIRV